MPCGGLPAHARLPLRGADDAGEGERRAVEPSRRGQGARLGAGSHSRRRPAVRPGFRAGAAARQRLVGLETGETRPRTVVHGGHADDGRAAGVPEALRAGGTVPAGGHRHQRTHADGTRRPCGGRRPWRPRLRHRGDAGVLSPRRPRPRRGAPAAGGSRPPRRTGANANARRGAHLRPAGRVGHEHKTTAAGGAHPLAVRQRRHPAAALAGGVRLRLHHRVLPAGGEAPLRLLRPAHPIRRSAGGAHGLQGAPRRRPLRGQSALLGGRKGDALLPALATAVREYAAFTGCADVQVRDVSPAAFSAPFQRLFR